METMIKIFENTEFGTIRTIDDNGKIMFCGSDVAKALGYSIPSKAINTHCRLVSKMESRVQTGLKSDGSPAMQMVEMLFIPEGDVYRLITHSKLPNAEQFESWVFDEVLPAIRQTGGYITKGAEADFINNPDSPLYSYINMLNNTIKVLQQQVLAIAPLAVNPKTLNIWKAQVVKPLIESIVSKLKLTDTHDAYELIYNTMTSKYGFTKSNVISRFCDKYRLESASVIDAVADDYILQSRFVNVATELLEGVGFTQNSNIASLLDSTSDKVVKVILPLAEKNGDTSVHYAVTHRRVYAAMGTARSWKGLRTRYGCKSNKGVLLVNDKKFKQFVDTVNKMMCE